MKKIISACLVIVFMISFCITASATDSKKTVQFKNGTEISQIVISESATQAEKLASSVLKDIINSVAGITVPVVTDSYAKSDGEIILGETERYDFNLSSKPNGYYEIKSDDSSVCICGTGSTGTLDGVYRFLEDCFGYKVYETGITTSTTDETVTIPNDIDISYTPFFEYRKLDTASTNYLDYARAHSLNGSEVRRSEKGAFTPYLGGFAHTLCNVFCKRDTYFADHPEYYALRDGKRVSDQLCLTNEDVLNIVTAEVLDTLRREWNPDDDLEIISLTQDDNNNFCTCEKCTALDNANGSHAGTMLTFVNAVADEVKKAGYDNVAVDTFAYQYTRHVPSNIKPADNVIVRLCSIECCFGHTIDDPTCKENVGFLEDLKGWSEICDRLYIWDYVNNYSETFLPFANFQVLQRNVQIFYENGAKGIYEEGNYYMHICNGEFYELRTYLLSEILENPYRTDFDDLMESYLTAVYGPGGTELHEYINIISDNSVTNKKHLYIRQQPRQALPTLKNKDITHIDELWKTAKEKAENDSQLNRIERSEISWQYWKCSNFKKEYSPFKGLYSYMKSHKDLADKIQAFGNIAVGEGQIKYLSTHPCRVLLFPCDFWETKHDGLPYDWFDSFAEKLYEKLEQSHNQ